MKVGLMFANVIGFGSPEAAVALAAASEAAGVESLWTVEHVVVPKDYASPYPYSPSGKMPGNEDSPIPDPLAWLAYVAALTTTVRLATGILILPQRSPVILAKEVATLDSLSGGRVTLGVGIGWLREEFEAIGVPFSERAARTDEAIRALRALWSNDETFEGRYYSFRDARMFPKPVQSGGVPIVIGGHTNASARRAGRLADGFFPASGDLPSLFAECRRAAEEAGRDPSTVELSAGGVPDLDFAKRMEDLGVSRIVLPPPAFVTKDIGPALEKLAETFVSKV
jgi:probable F420-dependent oxidoreductase